MPTSSLHIAKSGAQQGKWVACAAEYQCRNGGVHVTREQMREIKAQMKDVLGRTVTMNNVSATAAEHFIAQNEAAEEAKDKIVEATGQDVTKERMKPELVKETMREISNITGTRVLNYETARKAIVEKWEEVKDAPEVEDVYANIWRNRTGRNDLESNFESSRTFRVDEKKPILVTEVEYYGVSYKEKYDKIIAKETNVNLLNMETRSWEEHEQHWDDYERYEYNYDYYGDGEDISRDLSIKQEYYLTPEEQQQHENAKAKKELSKIIALAQEEQLPAWAIQQPTSYSFETNNLIRSIAVTNRKKQTTAETLQKRVTAAHKKGQAAVKLNQTKERLENEVTQAKEQLEATKVAVVKKALQDYVAKKEVELRTLEPKLKRAETASTTRKIVNLQNQLAEAEKAALDTSDTDAAWDDLTKRWLAERFPSGNGTHRNSEANKWLKAHPDARNRIKRIISQSEEYQRYIR